MSNVRVPKPTTVTICDICGKELPERDSYNVDKEAYSTIGRNQMGKTTTQTKHAKFRWPTTREHDKLPSGEKWKKENNVEYDFHGECLMNLVEAAVELRLKGEAAK